MFGLSIRVSADTATPALAATTRGLTPKALGEIVGRTGRNVVREHLAARDAKGNRLGGSRTHFFGQAARSTAFAFEGDAVVVSIASVGIAQRYFGGTIRPKSSKYLTIPARAEAYGKRAREWGDKLEVLSGRNGPYALARKSTKRGGGEVMYWLVKSVTQLPDKSVLPDDATLEAAVQPAVESYVQRLVARDSGPNN